MQMIFVFLIYNTSVRPAVYIDISVKDGVIILQSDKIEKKNIFKIN